MNGSIQVYYGSGRGKTTASLGLGIRAAGIGKRVIMVQFLKEKHSNTLELLKKLEPELKIFRFEKASENYEKLSSREQEEQKVNIRNALNYAKKVMDTGQCDLLILDDIFGLVDHQIMDVEELIRMSHVECVGNHFLRRNGASEILIVQSVRASEIRDAAFGRNACSSEKHYVFTLIDDLF